MMMSEFEKKWLLNLAKECTDKNTKRRLLEFLKIKIRQEKLKLEYK
jgi:hypothetical protein